LAIDIGTRRELFLDEFLIQKRDHVDLRLHHPVPREVAIVHDAPWEGNTCFYHTVFRDGNRYRMYHRGSHSVDSHAVSRQVVCYAESADGKQWEKPELGIVEFEGSEQNNIIWDAEIGAHNFAPFKDTNPDCRPQALYKAMGSKGMDALYAFGSNDGIHWSFLQDEPVITDGGFDSQNLAFWDAERGCYVEYHRDTRKHGDEKVRDIKTSTSDDFINWSQPVWLDYGDAPVEHLYINQIAPYYRAPHIYMGFPKRYTPKRTESDGATNGLSDSLFMSSRDGLNFHRWGEAFIRPGLQKERWINRNNMIAWGPVETESDVPGMPPEISLYSMEGYYRGESCQLRRFTLRLDGFVSINAPRRGGELLTKPLVFKGSELSLNVSTSAAGRVRVEIQDEAGQAVEGFALEDCEEIYGDDLDRIVRWKKGSDTSALSPSPVRLRFVMDDADLYSMCWR
jgi:hypothetical protein